MKARKKLPTRVPPSTPIYRAIPGDASAGANTRVHPAATEAALEELNRYADEIQQFMRDSKLRTIIEGIQGDLDRASRSGPRMRLRRK